MATIIKTPAGTFRAIICSPNKTLTKTFKLRKLAKAWAVRTEGDADLIALCSATKDLLAARMHPIIIGMG